MGTVYHFGWSIAIPLDSIANMTRKHSSRMRTACLPTIRVLVATIRCQNWCVRVGYGGPQVNKFQQASSDEPPDANSGRSGGGGE